MSTTESPVEKTGEEESNNATVLTKELSSEQPLTGEVLDPVKPTPMVPTSRPGQFVKGDPRIHRTGTKGIGRPRSQTRSAALMAFEDRIPILCDIADGKPLPFTKKVKYRRAQGKNKLNIENVEGDELTADTYSVVEGEESAPIAERIKALELLGKMGGAHIPGEEPTEDDPNAPPPVYVVMFDS